MPLIFGEIITVSSKGEENPGTNLHGFKEILLGEGTCEQRQSYRRKKLATTKTDLKETKRIYVQYLYNYSRMGCILKHCISSFVFGFISPLSLNLLMLLCNLYL